MSAFMNSNRPVFTLAAGLVHQIVNAGNSEMTLLAVLSETPARVFTSDGGFMALPSQVGPAQPNETGRGRPFAVRIGAPDR